MSRFVVVGVGVCGCVCMGVSVGVDVSVRGADGSENLPSPAVLPLGGVEGGEAR